MKFIDRLNMFTKSGNMEDIEFNDKIIGFIIGVPLEIFSEESWSHYDINLGKKNTIYSYIFIV